MYQHGPHTLPSRRLESRTQMNNTSRLLVTLHGGFGCHRPQPLGNPGGRSERTVNVRRGTFALEADAPVIAAAAAAAASNSNSSVPRRRIRRVDGSSNSSSNGSSRTDHSPAFSSSGVLTPLSQSQLPGGTPRADVSVAAAEGAAAAAAAADTSSSSSSSAPSAAGIPPVAADAIHAVSNGKPVSSAAGAAEAAAGAAVTSSSDTASETSDEEDEEYAKQLQEELQQASCCQDVLDIVTDEVTQFQSFHTVAALARLAKLGKGLATPQRLEVLANPGFILLLGRLCQQAAAGVMTPFELSNAVYSCGVLQVPLDRIKTSGRDSTSRPPALDILEASITSRAADFNDRDVSSTLYGYAQLKVKRQQSSAVISTLVSRAQSLVSKGACSPRCTSMILWALATLFGGSSSSSGGSSSSGSSSSNVPLHACAVAAARQLAAEACDFDALGPQGVANSLWGAVKLGCRQEELLLKAADWLAANTGRCKMQEVLNILWAAGASRHRPRQLGSIVAHVAEHAEKLKPADMASLFHVLGIFGFDFSSKQELLQQLLPRAQELLPQMKPFEVTSLFWGLGMIRQVDNQLFQDITAIVAKLQQQQAQAQAKLHEQQQQQQEQEQQQDQQQVAVLQARARQLSDSLQRQAFQAYIAARLEGVAVELPPEVLDALRGAWLAGNRSSRKNGGKQQLDPLLAEFEWLMQEMRVKGRVATRSKLDKLLAVDVELVASGQRLVAVQLLTDKELDSMGSRLAAVQWEEDVLRRNGYDEVYWLCVSDYKRVPKASRPRYVADLLRKLGVNPQERLVLAAEKAWAAAGCKPVGRSGRGSDGSSGSGAGGSWGGRSSAGDISAAEADVLMQDSSGSGGWASGGRGTRSKRNFNKRR